MTASLYAKADASQKVINLPRADLAPGSLRVAAAQPLVVPGDVEENLARMEPLVAEVSRRGAHLVLFSEAGLTGYDPDGMGCDAAITRDGPELMRVEAMARAYGMVIVSSFFERVKDEKFLTAAAVTPDGERRYQSKHVITPREIGFGMKPGPESRTIFSVNGVNLAITICADAGIQDLYSTLARNGCDIVLAPTAGLGDIAHSYELHELQDADRRAEYLKDAASVCFSTGAIETALEHGLGLLSCNQMGFDRASGFFHCGHSLIVDTDGRLAAVLPGQFVIDHLRPEVAVAVVHRGRNFLP